MRAFWHDIPELALYVTVVVLETVVSGLLSANPFYAHKSCGLCSQEGTAQAQFGHCPTMRYSP